MNTPKIVEKIILQNKDEFVQKFGNEVVDDLMTNKKSLKSMVDNFNIDFIIKDVIEDAITCFVLENK